MSLIELVSETVLLDAPLIADTHADDEMGPGLAELIADEELRGSRLLLVQQAVEPITINSALGATRGGAVKLACTFHPAPHTRFKQARLHLSLTAPAGVTIIDLQPRSGEGQPVKITLSGEGKLGFDYKVLKVEDQAKESFEFERRHRLIQGSGAGTAHARWSFSEDPVRQAGIPSEQILALTVPVVGRVAGTISLTAQLARGILAGGIREAVRTLVLGPAERHYPVTFDIPTAGPTTSHQHFYYEP